MAPDIAKNLPSKIVDWYQKTKRDLPWRKSRDPYKIWVSEVMLQQTRIETAIPYYERFLSLFPTMEALASADEEPVLKAWEGLGYYNRARNFQKAVREVCANYGGSIPEREADFIALPGVGPYTAGAVLSIAYGHPIPAVDGNVLRVCSRLFNIRESIDKVVVKKRIEILLRVIMPAHEAASFNQGMMELGALVCVPGRPRCENCPLTDECIAYRQGVQEQLPVRSKTKDTPLINMAAAVIKQGSRYCIRRRPDKGLLANLWEFPCVECGGSDPQQALQLYLHEQFQCGAEIEELKTFMQVKHVFSHQQWLVTFFQAALMEAYSVSAPERVKWATMEEMQQYPFAGPHRKVREALVKRTGHS